MAEKTGNKISSLLTYLESWPGPPLKRHNDAGYLWHRLVFVADIGLQISDPRLFKVVAKSHVISIH